MTKKSQKAFALAKAEYNPAEWWCCEGCGEHHHGTDPPDACTVCGHQYFDNWADMVRAGNVEYSRPYRALD